MVIVDNLSIDANLTKPYYLEKLESIKKGDLNRLNIE